MTVLARSHIAPASYREMTNRSGSVTTATQEERETWNSEEQEMQTYALFYVIIMCWWDDLCFCQRSPRGKQNANSRWLNKHCSSSGLEFLSCEASGSRQLHWQFSFLFIVRIASQNLKKWWFWPLRWHHWRKPQINNSLKTPTWQPFQQQVQSTDSSSGRKLRNSL